MSDKKDMLEEHKVVILDEVRALRAQGTEAALARAAGLEKRLADIQRDGDGNTMTVEHVQKWTAKVLALLDADGSSLQEPSVWDPSLRAELFECVDTCHAASRFRLTETAALMQQPRKLVQKWMDSPEWLAYRADAGPLASKMINIAHLAMSRLGSILAVDSDDIGVMTLQARVAGDVISAGGQRLTDGAAQQAEATRRAASAARKDAPTIEMNLTGGHANKIGLVRVLPPPSKT